MDAHEGPRRHPQRDDRRGDRRAAGSAGLSGRRAVLTARFGGEPADGLSEAVREPDRGAVPQVAGRGCEVRPAVANVTSPEIRVFGLRHHTEDVSEDGQEVKQRMLVTAGDVVRLAAAYFRGRRRGSEVHGSDIT